MRPGLKVGICGEHGGEPRSVNVLPPARAGLRVVFAVSRADRPFGRGPGRVAHRRAIAWPAIVRQPSAISHQPSARDCAQTIARALERCGRVLEQRRNCPQDQRGQRMGDFTKLAVWKKAHELTLGVYRRDCSVAEARAVRSHFSSRRSRSSVPANIAEGCGKNSDAELARHSRNSLGSASELSYYLILAHDLTYHRQFDARRYQAALSEVRRMLASLERVSATAAEQAAPWHKLHRKSNCGVAVGSADG